jgi:hypothetical protein
MTRRRLGVLAFALLIFGSMLVTNVLGVRQAVAAPDPPGTGGSSAFIQFLDRAHILVQESGTAQGGDMTKASGIYYNSNFQGSGDEGRGYGQGGPKHVGVGKAGGKECVGQILIKKYGDGASGEGSQAIADITFSVPPSDATSTKCVTVKFKDYPIQNPATGTADQVPLHTGGGNANSSMSNPVASSITYFKNDDKTIIQSDADPTYDTSSNATWHFVADGKTQCGSVLNYMRQANGGKPDFLTKVDGGSGTVEADYVHQNGGDPCQYSISSDITKSHHALVLLSRPDANTPFANSTGANGTDDLCSIPTWGLRWLACPLLLTAQKAIQGMDQVLQSLLVIGAGGMFDTNTETGKAFLDAERTFSTIAFSLLIIVALVIVAAQAIGFEILDAYTIRKVLPRLLAMVIILVLLVPIEKFTVQFADNLTNWSGDIIAYPFRSLGNVSNTGFGQIALQWFGTAAAFTFLDIGGVLSMAATMLLGIFVLILVLLGRKLLIMFALIIAPIGIVASILPNTRPLARFIYKDLTFPAILAGPAISASLGLTIAFAHVAQASNLGGVGGTAGVLIIIFGEFIPLWIMKRIGGTVSAVTGMVNDRSRGSFDRLKNYRGARIKANTAALKTGERFGESMFGRRNVLASTFNSATRGGTNVARAARAGGIGGIGRIGNTTRQVADQQAMVAAAEAMNSDGFKNNRENDDFLAAADFNSESQARRELARRWTPQNANAQQQAAAQQRANAAVDGAKAAGMKIGSQSFRVAGAMQRVSTGTGYENMEEMVGTLGRAAGGNESMARRLAGFANAEAKNKGRHDWAPGYGTLSRLTVATTQGGANAPTRDQFDAATVEAAIGTDNATLMRDKPYSVGNIAEAMERQLTQAQQNLRSPDAAVRADAGRVTAQIVAKLGNMRDSGLYAPEVNIQRMLDVTNGSAAIGQAEASVTGRVPIFDATTGRQTGSMNVGVSRVPALDPNTGTVLTEPVVDAAGNRVMGPNNVPLVRPVMREVPNGGAAPATVRLAEDLRNTPRMGGVNDPRFPG